MCGELLLTGGDRGGRRGQGQLSGERLRGVCVDHVAHLVRLHRLQVQVRVPAGGGGGEGGSGVSRG